MKNKKKPGFGRILLRVLCGLLILLLVAALTVYAIPLTENTTVKAVEDSGDWMAALDDSLRLNEIVLPGTHDSATKNVQLAFFSKCQYLTVGEQLEAGFRYLDIRLGEAESSLKLVHGFTNCKTGPMPWSDILYVQELLEQCYAFLKAHPSETVVFAVKHEHGDETAAAFARRLDALIAENAACWYTGSAIPTLGEVRGKLVLMRRYFDSSLPQGADCAGIELNWPDQNGHEDTGKRIEMTDNGSYRLWVQDRFEYDTEDKWTAFLAGLNDEQIRPEDLAIHFLSTKGSFAYGHPYRYAKELNQRLLTLPSDRLRGWIVVDFADAQLAAHIWAANRSS